MLAPGFTKGEHVSSNQISPASLAHRLVIRASQDYFNHEIAALCGLSITTISKRFWWEPGRKPIEKYGQVGTEANERIITALVPWYGSRIAASPAERRYLKACAADARAARLAAE